MLFTKKLVAFTATNAVIFFFFNLFFPDLLVFGTIIIGKYQAILTTALGLTIAHILFESIAEDFKTKYHKNNWITVFFLVNTATIYIFERTSLSQTIGIGVAGFWIAIILGMLATSGQYFVWKYFIAGSKDKKKS